MYCKFCGNEINDQSHECPHCGATFSNTNNNDDKPNKQKPKKEIHDPLKEKFVLFPIGKHICFFLVGWIGLSIIATIVVSFITIYYTNKGIDVVNDGLPIFGSVLSNFLAYFLTIVVLVFIVGLRSFKEIFKQFKNKSALIDGVAYGFLMLIVTAAVGMIITAIRGNSDVNANESAIRNMTSSYPFMMAIMTIVFAPICEETTYRLGLYNILRRYNRVVAYIITALVFALIHFTLPESGEDFTKNLVNELWNIPSYIISGVILCRAYEKHQSIATSMIAHAINNAVAIFSIIFAS